MLDHVHGEEGRVVALDAGEQRERQRQHGRQERHGSSLRDRVRGMSRVDAAHGPEPPADRGRDRQCHDRLKGPGKQQRARGRWRRRNCAMGARTGPTSAARPDERTADCAQPAQRADGPAGSSASRTWSHDRLTCRPAHEIGLRHEGARAASAPGRMAAPRPRPVGNLLFSRSCAPFVGGWPSSEDIDVEFPRHAPDSLLLSSRSCVIVVLIALVAAAAVALGFDLVAEAGKFVDRALSADRGDRAGCPDPRAVPRRLRDRRGDLPCR